MKEILEKKADEARRLVSERWKGVEEAKTTAESDPTDENRAAYNERYAKYEEAVDSHRKLDDEYKTELKRELGRLNASDSESRVDQGVKGASPGERFTSAAHYKAAIESGYHIPRVGVLSTDEMRAGGFFGAKALVTSEGAPGDDMILAARLPGLAEPRRAPLSLLNEFSTGTTAGNTIEWVRVASETNAAAVVPEATSITDDSALKPESDFTVSVETEPYHTIAHLEYVTRQALADIPGIQTLINNFLIDGVRRTLLNETISGDGSGNLNGVYKQAGITYTEQSSEGGVEAIFRGIQAVRAAFHEPTAVAMHPNDWTSIRLSRYDQGGGDGTGEYQFGPPSLVGADTLWGVRTIIDPAVTQGKPIVAEWSQGTVYTREGVRIYTTDSHADLFRRNIVTILAEGRFALVIQRPNAFAVVSHADY
jgi:HK97 family phage major capsid protein